VVSFAARAGESAPGLVAAALCAANLVFAWKWLPESRVFSPHVTTKSGHQVRAPEPRPVLDALWEVIRHPGRPAAHLIWIYAVAMLAYNSAPAVFTIYLAWRFGIGPTNIWWFFTVFGGVGVLMRAFVVGPVNDRLGEVRTMRLGATLYALGYALLPLAPSVPMFLLIQVLLPLGTALLFPANSALLRIGSLPAPRPRLVVVITVDQLRPDYLDRYRSQLTGGLALLLKEGAVFTEAYQDHAVTETAPGHSTILSGRWPAHTGIVRNTAGVQDSTAPLVGVTGLGASPARFRGTALFDWLKAAEPGARALSVSGKDRGAILPLGRAKEQVYWYAGGYFTTSRYYADSLPEWVRVFNGRRIPFKAAGANWNLLLPARAYPEPDSEPYENSGKDFT